MTISNWDQSDQGANWDSGLQWDVNQGPSPGSITPYLALIPPENQPQPKFIAMMSLVLQPLADAQAVNLSMPSLFDLDAAVGVQLDAVGVWVGASRYLQEPVANVYFKLGPTGPGLGVGILKSPGNTDTVLVSLPDSYYRILIRAKILNNQWNGTVPGAYAIWNAVFAGTGIGILIQDYGNMHMGLALTGTTPDALTLALFITGYFNVKPAGVAIDYYMTPSSPGTPYFGLGVENSVIAGLGVGAFGVVNAGPM